MPILLSVAMAAMMAAAAPSRTGEENASALLDRTVWVDIGIGRTLATMKAKEIAALKRCKEPTLYFEKSGQGLAETFYAGLMMRTEYPRVALQQDGQATTVLLYNAGNPEPAEALRLTENASVLVAQTRGFRPRTFLRCDPQQRHRK